MIKDETHENSSRGWKGERDKDGTKRRDKGKWRAKRYRTENESKQKARNKDRRTGHDRREAVVMAAVIMMTRDERKNRDRRGKIT